MDSSLAHKTFVVTGATSGIGLAATRLLLMNSHSVIGVARSPDRCRRQEEAVQQARASGAQVKMISADLALQSEVLRVAQEIGSVLADWRTLYLDGLINNAATVPFWQVFTPEGFDMQWAVNHLAPFLLTLKLLPFLKRAPLARVVTVSSGSHYNARLNWEDIQLRRHYNPLRAYGQTKLANVLFTVELDHRLRNSTRVRAFAADPGLVNTELGLKSNSFLARWAWDLRRRGGITPEESARGIVYLATEPSIQEADDLYWKHGRPKAASLYGLNQEAAAQLWKLSAQMCGLEASEEMARA
jgi:NAD(P)-dependent dehydrogenase (short-subunit alcohol dehydrogenase family)